MYKATDTSDVLVVVSKLIGTKVKFGMGVKKKV